VEAQSHRHRLAAAVFERQGQTQRVAGQQEFLPGAIGKRPGTGAVIVFQRDPVLLALDHAPRRLPAMAMQGVRLRPMVARQRDRVPAEREPSIANAVRKRHQGKAGEPIGRSSREVRGCGRSKPVVPPRSVEPVVMRDRTADPGRNAGAGAIRAQGDDGAGVFHARGQQERKAKRSPAGRAARSSIGKPRRFSLKCRA
jgi:hypothetical protein